MDKLDGPRGEKAFKMSYEKYADGTRHVERTHK